MPMLRAARERQRVLARAAEIVAGDRDPAARRPLQPGHDHQQRRLAGAARTDDGHRLASPMSRSMPRRMATSPARLVSDRSRSQVNQRFGHACRVAVAPGRGCLRYGRFYVTVTGRSRPFPIRLDHSGCGTMLLQANMVLRVLGCCCGRNGGPMAAPPDERQFASSCSATAWWRDCSQSLGCLPRAARTGAEGARSRRRSHQCRRFGRYDGSRPGAPAMVDPREGRRCHLGTGRERCPAGTGPRPSQDEPRHDSHD